MKKIVNIILSLAIISLLVFPYQSAQAVSYTHINYLTFATKLEDFLWAWRNKTGICERIPVQGGCLQGSTINEVLDFLTDPNQDGNFADSYFKISDPNIRVNFLQNAKSHPDISYIMRLQVLNFERSMEMPIWINIPDVDGTDPNHQIDEVFKELIKDWEIQADTDYKNGDAFLMPEVFEIIEGVSKIILRNKIFSETLYKIYQTERMSPFLGNCKVLNDGISCDSSDPASWSSGELDEFNKLSSLLAAVETKLKSKMTPTEAEKVQKAMELVEISESSKYGLTIYKNSQPSGYSFNLGGRTVNLTSSQIVKMFSGSSIPSIAVRYQRVLQNIADSANMIYKTNRTQVSSSELMPGLNDMLVFDIRKMNVMSRENLPIYCNADFSINGCFKSSNGEIYYADDAVVSPEFAYSVIIHELFHSIRLGTGFSEGGPSLFEESYTDWMTMYTLHQNGHLYSAISDPERMGGYLPRYYFYNIEQRLMKQKNWNLSQAQKFLQSTYFHQPYSAIDGAVGKAGFYQNLNKLFTQYRDACQQALGASTPGERKLAFDQEINLKKAIIAYILN